MWHSNTPPVRNRTSLTAQSSLRCVSAAEQYKTRKHLPRNDLSWNTLLDFLKIPSLWEAALETKRRCFSNAILESNVTPNITRSSDSSANSYWGWLGMHCERPGEYHSHGHIRIHFHSQRSHHSLTLQRSRISAFDTVTLTPGDDTTSSKWSHQHYWFAYFQEWKKAPKCTGGTITGPKHCAAALLTQR